MSYKMTRNHKPITEYYGKLDIISTIDEHDESIWFIDIVYHNTDVGITYIKTDKANYTKDLSIMEAFCQGYNKALDDVQEYARNNSLYEGQGK